MDADRDRQGRGTGAGSLPAGELPIYLHRGLMFRYRSLALLLLVALLMPFEAPSAAAGPISGQAGPAGARIAPWVLAHTADGAQAEFLVLLADRPDLSAAGRLAVRQERGRYVRDTLWQVAQSKQAPLRAWLDAAGVEYRSYYIVNLLWVRGDRALVLALAARPDVVRIEGNPEIRSLTGDTRLIHAGYEPFAAGQSPAASTGVEPNIAYVHAPQVWALGYTGQGIVVGGQDTGYDWTHPALKPHYRGWDGMTANHDFNWHDSIHSGGGGCGANSPQPCDDYGHGTHTMGTAVGDDGAGNQIGMAPGAQWIGCRNMNVGVGKPSTYLECFEFFLAPYPVNGTPAQGDPGKAPDVTNNSWDCPPEEGCAPDILQQAVDAQRAAGILTVVSAGNGGPACSTVKDPPAIYAGAYTVAALVTGSDTAASFSSRGPVTVDGSNRRKPDISAPGTTIRSSVPGGGYQNTWSGTSMASPHVVGAVALLWSARPTLKNQITETQQVLSDTAVHIASTACSSSGWPNNTFGYGRLDALAAVQQATLDVGALHGAVANDQGRAVAAARVQAQRAGEGAFSATSTSSGAYTLTLPAGTYTVTAAAAGYLPFTATQIAIAAHATATLDIRLTVTPTYAITGVVRDASTHLPLPATVSLAGSVRPLAQTDPATGYYSVRLPAGTYTLAAAAAAHQVTVQVITVDGSRRLDFDLARRVLPYRWYFPWYASLGSSYARATRAPTARRASRYNASSVGASQR